MDYRVSREQIAAIIRQRVERHLGAAPGPAALFDDRIAAVMQNGDVAVAFPREPPIQVGGGGAVNRRFFPRRLEMFRQASLKDEDESNRTRNVSVEGDIITYMSTDEYPDGIGVFVSGKALTSEVNYFEVEILEKGAGGIGLTVGVVSRRYSLRKPPGHSQDSVAFSPSDRLLFAGRRVGSPFGVTADIGDKVGCGLKFAGWASHKGPKSSAPTFFVTVNGKEVGAVPVSMPPGGYFPAVSLKGVGEEVCFRQGLRFVPEEDVMMLVDSGEDDWLNLHDIRLNGPVLEYVGQGKSLVDVGLAQAKYPISTRNHYFEIEIIDPGLSCFIAIGLARKDYPKNRHPGWNRGSIAYHADDGKLFAGSGIGAPFGPRCHKGDIMGCGVLFPRNYECRSDSEEELEQQGGGVARAEGGANQYNVAGGVGVAEPQDFGQVDYTSDSDDDWWNDRNYTPNGVKVNIYFTRNGNVIGKKEVRIPKGGFYPTVGMMSSQEKVRVDLRPLSG